VLVVGRPGLAGAATQLRVVRDLVELGVPGDRFVPVLNRAPRNPRARAEAGEALARLLAATDPGVTLASSLVCVPDRRRLGDLLRDGAPLPAAVVRPLAGAVRALLDQPGPPTGAPPATTAAEPVPVAPGSLGSWTDAGTASG
jgi:hypothetical protein